MHLLLSIVYWFLVSCLVMSFLEFFVHRFLMHRRLLPRWLYVAIPGFRRVFENHAVLHHGRYYKVFNHEDDPRGRRISIRLDLWIVLVAGGVVWALTYWLTPVAGPVFAAVGLLHHLAWNCMHEEMHNPRPRWFARTGLFRFFARYHWMHHRYPGKNYNVVLPCADFVLGKHQRPSDADLAAMSAIGLGERPAPASVALPPRSISDRGAIPVESWN